MSLRLIAAADARAIVEDVAAFSWPVTVTSPAGISAQLNGQTRDISAAIDPETGMLVSGRTASVTLSMASLNAAGLGIPKGVPETLSKPWVVQFYDVNNVLHVFKVSEALPDNTVGVVICKLEAYKLAPQPAP